MDELRSPLQVTRQKVANVLAKDVERRPPVERDDHVCHALGHAMALAAPRKRRAALRKPRRHAHASAQHDAGKSARKHVPGDLHGAAARARQAADQVAAFDFRRHVGDQRGDVGRVRIGVHDAKMRGAAGYSRAPGEHVIFAFAQPGGHHRERRLVEVFNPARNDPDADCADPVHDSGAPAELGNDPFGMRL